MKIVPDLPRLAPGNKQQEERKAPADLEDKIKKASADWKGVDVDAFMDEVRGRETDLLCRITD